MPSPDHHANGPRWNLRRTSASLGAGYLLLLSASCEFDSGSRWIAFDPPPPEPPLCEVGTQRCTDALEECREGTEGLEWRVVDDCAAKGLICASALLACAECNPEETFCENSEIRLCNDDGFGSTLVMSCQTDEGFACRGGACVHLCSRAGEEKSNVGCEYWAVDLDNAMVDLTRNAQAQQYAVVVSNPQHDLPVDVRIYQDDTEPGEEGAPFEIAQATIPPLNLRVFKLGPREVDGSPEGEFNTGTHSALSRKAYRINSDFPVVSYQFNPLENVNVFSNDASLLKPTEALTFGGDELGLSYVVSSWPQTIAITDDPNTNFSANNPINLRVFLTIVATRDDTLVRVNPTVHIRAGDGVPETLPNSDLELELDAFDVLNLEPVDINAFNADFTGSLIHSNKPVAVFAGGEASDAPHFETLSERRCCADHLEEQLDPVRTAGKKFALAHSPSRTAAVLAAGGNLGVAPEPEHFRFVSIRDTPTTIETTLPPPDDEIRLFRMGDFYEVETTRDFLAESDQPVHVIQVMASQDAANVPRGLPGGDPSMLVVPPREQFRRDYVFLTPDKYAFDFVTIVAPFDATVTLDDVELDTQICDIRPTDGLTGEERDGEPISYLTYTCQLSFATVNPDTGEVLEGMQDDGVHRINASHPVGVTVFGFDAYVSYAYAGGTELRELAPPL